MKNLGQKIIIECPACEDDPKNIGPIVNDYLLGKCDKIQSMIFTLKGVQLPIREILRMALVIGLEGLQESFIPGPTKPKKPKKKPAKRKSKK